MNAKFLKTMQNCQESTIHLGSILQGLTDENPEELSEQQLYELSDALESAGEEMATLTNAINDAFFGIKED